MPSPDTPLDLATAQLIAGEVIGRRRQLGYAALTVAVLDQGGHVIVLHREDGSGILRPQIAMAKAWGALGMGMGSRTLAGRAALQPGFFAALATLAPGGLLAVPGGVLVRASGGALLGAVGVSGDTSDRDEECALHGIRAAGLRPDPGESDGT